MSNSVEHTGQAGTENRRDAELRRKIARMLSEWEDSEELPTEMADRLIDLVRERSR